MASCVFRGSYMAWQVLYLVKTELFDSEKLRRDQDLQTSIRWLTRDRGGLPYGLPLANMLIHTTTTRCTLVDMLLPSG